MKSVIVGMAPGRRGDNRRPFDGPGSGTRLLRLAGSEIYGDLISAFDVVNLIESYPGLYWPTGLARLRAGELRRTYRGRTLILAGRRVAEAFGIPRASYLTVTDLGDVRLAVLPHPSGLSRWYNDPVNVDSAEAFLRTICRCTRTPTG